MEEKLALEQTYYAIYAYAMQQAEHFGKWFLVGKYLRKYFEKDAKYYLDKFNTSRLGVNN